MRLGGLRFIYKALLLRGHLEKLDASNLSTWISSYVLISSQKKNSITSIMGGNGPSATTIPNLFEVRRALAIAQNTEYDTLDPAVRDLLERTNARIWDRIHAEPASYVLSTDEFAVFNFYQNEWEDKREIAVAAVRRYWDSQPQRVNGL